VERLDPLLHGAGLYADRLRDRFHRRVRKVSLPPPSTAFPNRFISPNLM
jgi:hypothetical protein